MAIIKIPGGAATIRDKLVSEKHFRILESSYVSVAHVMEKMRYALSAYAMTKLGLQPDTVISPSQAKLVEETIKGLTPEEQNEALEDLTLSRQDTVAMLELQDAAIVAFLESWTLKQPLPNLDTVTDLPREIYAILADATKDKALQSFATLPNFDPSLDPASEDPNSNFTTGDSNASSGASSVIPQNPSITGLPTNTVSTPTEIKGVG